MIAIAACHQLSFIRRECLGWTIKLSGGGGKAVSLRARAVSVYGRLIRVVGISPRDQQASDSDIR